MILDSKILDYVYFTVFYTDLYKDNIKHKVQRIYKEKYILKNLDIRHKISFKLLIVKLIKYNNYKLIYYLLYLRKMIRDMFI